MTDEIENVTNVEGVTEVEDYSVRKRIGGLLAVGGFGLVWSFLYTGRRDSIPVATELGFGDLMLEGIVVGLLAIVVGISISLSGYVTD